MELFIHIRRVKLKKIGENMWFKYGENRFSLIKVERNIFKTGQKRDSRLKDMTNYYID